MTQPSFYKKQMVSFVGTMDLDLASINKKIGDIENFSLKLRSDDPFVSLINQNIQMMRKSMTQICLNLNDIKASIPSVKLIEPLLGEIGNELDAHGKPHVQNYLDNTFTEEQHINYNNHTILNGSARKASYDRSPSRRTEVKIKTNVAKITDIDIKLQNGDYVSPEEMLDYFEICTRNNDKTLKCVDNSSISKLINESSLRYKFDHQVTEKSESNTKWADKVESVSLKFEMKQDNLEDNNNLKLLDDSITKECFLKLSPSQKRCTHLNCNRRLLKPRYEKMEIQVSAWVKRLYDRTKKPVLKKAIIERAKILSNDHKFVASNYWYVSFLRRNKIAKRKITI